MSRIAVVLSVLALLVISALPISRALLSSVLVHDRPDAPVELTLDHYAEAFGPAQAVSEGEAATGVTARRSGARFRMLGNSVAIGLVAALLALLIGVPYALLISRTDVPLRGLLGSLYIVPLVLPPLIVTVAWNYIPALEPPPINSAPDAGPFGGALAILRAGLLFALCYYPLVVLFARRALSRVPPSLEEAARLAGGAGMALRRVTLPLAAPGMLAGALFVFLFALNDFAVVDFLNWVRPTSAQVSVYPFESFVAWSRSDGPGVATALGVPLAALGVALLWVIHRLVSKEARHTATRTLSPPEPFALGALRWPAASAALALLAVTVAVPIGALAWRAGGVDAYQAIWAIVAGPRSGSNEIAWTLWLAGGAAILSLPLAFVIAHRTARSGRWGLLALSLLPLALPPVFLGAGYLRLLNALPWDSNPFLDPDSPRYGPMLLLVAKYVPFAIAALWAAFLEIDPRLEEAAAAAGAKPLSRALAVLEPLVRPALGLAFVLVFVLALREIDTIVLLSSESVMRKVYTMIHFQRDEQVAALCVILVLMQAIPFAVLALLVPRRLAMAQRVGA